MKRYDISIFLKLLACFIIIGVWSYWITFTTEQVEEKLLNKEIKYINKITHPIKTEIEPEANPKAEPQEVKVKPEEKKAQPIEVESPKKAEIKPEQKEVELPKKAEVKPEQKKETINIKLRNEKAVKKDKQKLLITEFKKEINSKKKENLSLDDSWIPLYLSEREEVNAKRNDIINNLDSLINSIQLINILTNTNGKKVAVIKNIENSKVSYITAGEEFWGLKVDQIQDNEITLSNDLLNRKYTKRLSVRN